MSAEQDQIQARLERETGTLYGAGRRAVALTYPSPYPVAMSSLGFQAVYRGINALEDAVAERAFLPDDAASARGPLLTYESRRPVSDFAVVAFSVAYELELQGVFRCLELAGVPATRQARRPGDPWVVAGGPLTFSNPVPLAPYCDVIVMGEAEDLLAPLLDALFRAGSRADGLRALADLPGFYVPEHHGEQVPPVAQCEDSSLPASSCVWTPESALSNMHLVETERGCSRGCTFCVMRRTTNGGMRVVPVERVLAAIPDAAPRVGLVGAAVSDHPRLLDIVAAVVDSGREVGLSSLRSDRLTPELVELLERGGYRTLTVASDGASERLRIGLEKKIRERHLLRAAELAGAHGVEQLKIYMMLGAPDEREEDLDELIDLTRRQDAIAGPRTRISLGISPFVAKRNTPLDGAPWAGVREVDRRVERVRKALRPNVEVRPTSARWAWVEYVLAQGGEPEGRAVYAAWRDGGSYSAFRRAFAELGHRPDSL